MKCGLWARSMFSLVLLIPYMLRTRPGWEGEGQPPGKHGRGMGEPGNGRVATSLAAACGSGFGVSSPQTVLL